MRLYRTIIAQIIRRINDRQATWYQLMAEAMEEAAWSCVS